mgnify:FL=1
MNLKALMEKREELQGVMDALVSAADTEERAMTEEETEKFDKAEKEIRAIDETISRADRVRKLEKPEQRAEENTEDAEERAFANYVLGRASELRAGEQNMTMSNNGAIIPTSIANRNHQGRERPLPDPRRRNNLQCKGTLKVPVWGKANTTHDIAVGYQTEFTAITADSGKFTSIDLGGYLAGALVLIGRSVENNSAFNVTSFIINQMAEEIACWIEGQLLKGTGSDAAQGALNTTATMAAAAATAVTADELISLQAMVKQAYQRNACWTMHPDTFTALRKLKDGNNRYLLQDDITGEFPYRLLGKPVYVSDNMPTMAAGSKAILYGDYSGLSVNFRENISVEVLRENYATQHALGVISWFEFDAKVTDNQKLAVLTMKAS